MDPRKQVDPNMERDNQHNNGKTIWQFRMQVAVTLSDSDVEQGDVSDKGYAVLLKNKYIDTPPPKMKPQQLKRNFEYQPGSDSVILYQFLGSINEGGL